MDMKTDMTGQRNETIGPPDREGQPMIATKDFTFDDVSIWKRIRKLFSRVGQ